MGHDSNQTEKIKVNWLWLRFNERPELWNVFKKGQINDGITI